MSLNTQTTVSIGGQQFHLFHSLQLQQSLEGHHTFEILIGYDWLQRLGTGIFTAGREFLGKEVSIVIKPVEAGNSKELIFNGLVTAVSAGKEGDGTHGYCVVKGSSPTILLDNEPHIQSFEQKSLSDIVSSCLRNCMPYTSQPTVAPRTGESLKYTVQYKESHYQFVRRLAARYGEWFFYDGQKIIFGQYSPRKTELTHQADLIDFDLELQVVANNSRFAGYEYRLDVPVDKETGGAAASGLYAGHAAEVSNRLYNKSSLFKMPQAFTSGAKAQLENFAEAHQKSRQAQLASISGTSKHPGLRIGDTVSINESLYGKAHHGDFMVTAITHHCTGTGLYKNTFSGIPAEAAAPHVDIDAHPLSEPQSAIVTDNNDPKGLGRVRARLRWQSQGSTPWMRLIAPHGGGGKGFYFVPEIGEEVWVDFEGGNPDLPFVLGTTYNGNAKTEFGTAQNDLKVIKTRSGHTIRLDDSAGSENIVITDISGNIITLNTKTSTIDINAPETLNLNAKNINILAKESIIVNAGENITSAAGENISQHASKDHLLTASNSSVIVEKKSSMVANEIEKTAQKVRVDSTAQNMELVSSRKIDIQSAEKIRLF